MLHTTQSNWSPKGESSVFLDGAGGFDSGMAMTVSSLDTSALTENQGRSETVAMTIMPKFEPSQKAGVADVFSADLAVLAMGLIGAWMILVGTAMLARRMRLIRLEQTQI